MSTTPPTTLAPTTLSGTLAPTTAPPTTLVPTTTLTTATPTTTLTTLAPTTVAPIDIDAGPIEVILGVRHLLTIYPPAARDPSIDKLWSVNPIEITLTQIGEQLNKWIDAGAIEITLSETGSYVVSTFVLSAGAITITILPDFYKYIVERKRCNWVGWSQIGRLDFSIDHSNIAGWRPMDWKGCVWELIKLGQSVVVYGENGVSVMTPHQNAWGLRTILRIGIIGRQAAVGTDEDHYFIDKNGKLYHLNERGLELLDYSEFLSVLSEPVMLLDVESGMIYICDGVRGFVYSTADKSLGTGPVNVTGLGYQDGAKYVVAPEDIVTPTFELLTDIYDLGVRKPKTINFIEIGTDAANLLQAQVEYRLDSREVFRKGAWHLVNPNGYAYPVCFGIEFRFRLKALNYEYFELDYLKVGGMIHEFEFTDLADMYRGQSKTV